MESDIDAILAGLVRTGVVSGCAVSAQGTPNKTVAVAAGRAIVAGALVTVAGGNVTLSDAHASLDRIDLVWVNSVGTAGKTDGTAASSSTVVAPAVPANCVLLAMVYHPAGDSAINSNQITDKRVMLDVALPTTSIFLSSNLSVDAAVSTDVPMAGEEYDDPGWHSTGVQTERVTVTRPGLYLLNGCVAFAANATGARDLWFGKNGSSLFPNQRVKGDASNIAYLTTSQTVRLAAGDYVTLRVRQESGVALNALASYTRLQVTYLGPTP